jgi:hypothetical protein
LVTLRPGSVYVSGLLLALATVFSLSSPRAAHGDALDASKDLSLPGVRISIRLSEAYPFDPAKATSVYKGNGPVVYAYLVLRSEHPEDPAVGRLELDFDVDTKGIDVSDKGLVLYRPWRKAGSSHHPTRFIAKEPVDCTKSRAIGHWELRLLEGSGSTAIFEIEPHTSAGYWQPRVWDGSGSAIPPHLVAGAAVNSDAPPLSVYPFWEFVPVEGRFPPSDGPVAEWLEEKGPDPFPISGMYSWSNLRMGMLNVDGDLGGWRPVPMHMMPRTNSVLFLREPSFWLRGPQMNGHAPLYRMDFPTMKITNLGYQGAMFPGTNSRDFVVSNGPEKEASYYDDKDVTHTLQITAAHAQSGDSELYVLGWMPRTTVFDGANYGGRLLYDTYDLRGRLVHRTATDLIGYPLGAKITRDGTLVAVVREVKADPDGARSVLENARGESIIRIRPGHAMESRRLRAGWAPMELLDYGHGRIVIKHLDLLIVLDAGTLTNISRFLFPWESYGREPGLIASARILSKNELLVSTYGRKGKPSDPSERLQLVAALDIRGKPLVEYCDGPGLRKPELPWAYQTNRPTLMELGGGLLATVADGVGMVLYREFGDLR